MTLRVVVFVVIASLAAHGAAASTAAESARITISKVTIDRSGNATVKVAISGFAASRGHWDLAYKLVGASPGFSDRIHVRAGPSPGRSRTSDPASVGG